MGSTSHATETHCHCGSEFKGSDHCPECHCEQYESVCDHKVLVPTHQWTIEELEMGVRPYNILKRMDVHTLGELSAVTSDDVARWAHKNQCPLGDHDYANIHQQVEKARSIFRGEAI